jgi:hypothetical protein
MNKTAFRAIACAACLLVACHHTQNARTSSPDEMDATRLNILLANVQEWPDDNGTTNYPKYNWIELGLVAKIIQNCPPRQVEKALHQYQLMGSQDGDFQSLNENQLRNDKKLYLLMRMVFWLPEAESGVQVFCGGWVRPPGSYDLSAVHNVAWPVQWNNGHPALVSGYGGLQGINARYNAAEEYHYFLSKYRMRDISSFLSTYGHR